MNEFVNSTKLINSIPTKAANTRSAEITYWNVIFYKLINVRKIVPKFLVQLKEHRAYIMVKNIQFNVQNKEFTF